MKNTIVLFFLFIPAIIACQNSVNVSNNSSVQPSKSTVTTITPSINIISTVTPSANVIPSVSQLNTPIPTTPSSTIQESVTPIIESNMLEFIPVPSNLPTLPPFPPSSIFTPHDNFYEYNKLTTVSGSVFDDNGNTVSNVNVTLKNIYNQTFSDNNYIYYNYDYTISVKTNLMGEYKIQAPESMFFILTAEKEGYTKRSFSDHTLGRESYNFGGNSYESKYKYLSKVPEIEKVIINGNVVTKYDRNKLIYIPSKNKLQYQEYLSNIDANIIDSQTEIAKFKIKSIDTLIIGLEFNNSIKRSTLEENIYIQSINKGVEYNTKTNSSSFNWFNEDRKVIFKVPISEKLESTKYRLAFKSNIIDTDSNQSLNTLIAIQEPELLYSLNTELAENIIFEIEGKK